MRWLTRDVSSIRILTVFLFVGAFAVFLGCKQRELPGEPIGVYRVVGTLEENTCGPTGLQAVDPLLFKVEVRDDEGIGVWALEQKPFLLGTIKRNGEFLFRLENRFTVSPPEPEPEPDPEFFTDPEFFNDPEAYRETRECHLSQVEVIRGTVALDGNARALDGGDIADVDLIGSDSIDIQPIANAECVEVLASEGGSFATLPCRAIYTLEGELSDE